LETWQHIGHQIFLISDSSAWWLGDWLVFGQQQFPDRYGQAIARTSLDYQTLRNYAWVARKFAPSRRRDKLSFQHHVEVAALPIADQDRFLAQAERMGWSRNELRRQVRRHLEPSICCADAKAVSVLLTLEPGRAASWQAAAERATCALPEWIASVVDAAASGGPDLPPFGTPASAIGD